LIRGFGFRHSDFPPARAGGFAVQSGMSEYLNRKE